MLGSGRLLLLLLLLTVWFSPFLFGTVLCVYVWFFFFVFFSFKGKGLISSPGNILSHIRLVISLSLQMPIKAEVIVSIRTTMDKLPFFSGLSQRKGSTQHFTTTLKVNLAINNYEILQVIHGYWRWLSQIMNDGTLQILFIDKIGKDQVSCNGLQRVLKNSNINHHVMNMNLES